MVWIFNNSLTRLFGIGQSIEYWIKRGSAKAATQVVVRTTMRKGSKQTNGLAALHETTRPQYFIVDRLQGLYVRSLRALPSLGDLELDFLTLLERVKTLADNG
jgi:type II secretory pathway predicted ATPase ExeA